MWVLAVAEGASATFRSIVGGFPHWVLEECTQPAEMVQIEMLLLPAQRAEPCRLSIRPPDLVSPLRFRWSSSVAQVVFPDGEPLFKERAGHAQLAANGPVQQSS